MATNLSALEAAMVEATASRAPVERPHMKPVTREQYAAARADLDARARAGRTVMLRNCKGQFVGSTKVFSFGNAPAIPAHNAPRQKAAPVAPVAAPSHRRRDPARAPAVALSAEA